MTLLKIHTAGCFHSGNIREKHAEFSSISSVPHRSAAHEDRPGKRVEPDLSDFPVKSSFLFRITLRTTADTVYESSRIVFARARFRDNRRTTQETRFIITLARSRYHRRDLHLNEHRADKSCGITRWWTSARGKSREGAVVAGPTMSDFYRVG